MQVAQRGTTATCNSGSNTYSMDRWYARGESSLGVFTLSQEDIAANNQGVKYAAKVTVTNNVTPGSGDVYKIAQRIEGQNLAQLELGRSTAKSFTLSFIVKSSVTGTHSGSFMNSAQNRSFPFTYTISQADTWEQKSITIPGDTAGTWLVDTGIGLELNFDMGSGSGKRGSAGGAWLGARAEGATGAVQVISSANATWFISKVQIEVGSVATDFEHRSFGQELDLCQRYYQRYTSGNNSFRYLCVGTMDNDNATGQFVFNFIKPFRTNVSSMDTTGDATDYAMRVATTETCTSVPSFSASSNHSCFLNFAKTNIGFSTGLAVLGILRSNNSYLGFSAEL